MPRPTETEEFWRDEFTVTEKEETDLQEYFLQQNKPLRLDEITRFLMEKQHVGRAKSLEASNGAYTPTGEYEVGEKLSFPFLDGEVGEVVGVREGRNPRYGSFQVIEVRFPGESRFREFAATLSERLGHMIAGVDEPPMEMDELFERFGSLAREEVDAALEASSNFVSYGGQWLPRLMLVDFHEGHLNIADAMIDIMGEPLTASELLKEIAPAEESSDEVQRFSLELLLAKDPRFTNVGTDDEPRWHLKRLS